VLIAVINKNVEPNKISSDVPILKSTTSSLNTNLGSRGKFCSYYISKYYIKL